MLVGVMRRLYERLLPSLLDADDVVVRDQRGDNLHGILDVGRFIADSMLSSLFRGRSGGTSTLTCTWRLRMLLRKPEIDGDGSPTLAWAAVDEAPLMVLAVVPELLMANDERRSGGYVAGTSTREKSELGSLVGRENSRSLRVWQTLWRGRGVVRQR